METMKETVIGRERLDATRRREDEHMAREVERSDGQAARKRRLEETTSTQEGSAEQVSDRTNVSASLPTNGAVPVSTSSSSSNPMPSTMADDVAVGHGQGEKRPRDFIYADSSSAPGGMR